MSIDGKELIPLEDKAIEVTLKDGRTLSGIYQWFLPEINNDYDAMLIRTDVGLMEIPASKIADVQLA